MAMCKFNGIHYMNNIQLYIVIIIITSKCPAHHIVLLDVRTLQIRNGVTLIHCYYPLSLGLVTSVHSFSNFS